MATPVYSEGNYVDSGSGLLVPRTYSRNNLTSVYTYSETFSDLSFNGFAEGTRLTRDADTMVVRFPRKGSGYDDIVSEAIVDGTVANVGISPVIAPMISAMVVKQQHQASTATIELSGKRSPVNKAREAISRFNDSPLGATDSLMKIVHDLRTYNRGAHIATVPIMYNMDVWDDYGMTAHEFRSKGKFTGKYFLEVDWAKFGTPIPFIPSPFDLEATGNQQFPYWYRARKGSAYAWVLLHQSQILQLTTSKTSLPGIGMSSVWMCLGYLAEDILVVDERVERKVNAITDGLIGISGVSQTAKQIKTNIDSDFEENRQMGNLVAKGYTVLTSPNNEIKFVTLRFRQDDGVDFEKRRQSNEDVIALAFNVPLTEVVLRGGVGFGAQADVMADVNAEGGVGSLLHMIAIALGSIYERVQVSIKRPNDRARRLNIKSLTDFATAMQSLHANGQVILSAAEQRGIIQRDIVDIPVVSADTTSRTATNDDTGDEPPKEPPPDSNPPAQPPKPAPAPEEDDELAVAVEKIALARQLLRELAPIEPTGADAPIESSEPDPQNEGTDGFDRALPEYAGLLNARYVDAAEVPEENANAAFWLWLALAFLYVRPSDDREVDRDLSITLRDALVAAGIVVTNELAARLAEQEITVQQWVAGMEAQTQQSYTSAYRLGRGGVDAMEDEDYSNLVIILVREFAVIASVADRIAAGLLSQGQVAAYSGSIIRGATGAYERGNAAAYDLPELPQYPGDGQTECQHFCKCHLQIRTINGDGNQYRNASGDWDIYWRLGNADHCVDCVRLSEQWNPLRVREGVIV